ALWQRTWLDGETMAVGLQYWKDQLSGIPDQISLPVDRPRSAVQTYAASVCVSTAPVDLVIKLNRIARDSGGTLYMTLLAGFALLLHRYTTQDDIVVGSPIANRQDTQLEQMIGIFVNSLVMRTRVKPEQSFRELLSE